MTAFSWGARGRPLSGRVQVCACDSALPAASIFLVPGLVVTPKDGVAAALVGPPPPLPFAPEMITAGTPTGSAEMALFLVSRRGGLWRGPGMRSAGMRHSGSPCRPLLRSGPALSLQSSQVPGTLACPFQSPCATQAPGTSLDSLLSADSTGTSHCMESQAASLCR